LAGVIALLSVTVPADAFLALKTNEELAEAPSPLYLAPTETRFTAAPASRAAGVASKLTSSIWFEVLEVIFVMLSSGVTSSMSVLSPTQSELSPVESGLKCTILPAPGHEFWKVPVLVLTATSSKYRSVVVKPSNTPNSISLEPLIPV